MYIILYLLMCVTAWVALIGTINSLTEGKLRQQLLGEETQAIVLLCGALVTCFIPGVNIVILLVCFIWAIWPTAGPVVKGMCGAMAKLLPTCDKKEDTE